MQGAVSTRDERCALEGGTERAQQRRPTTRPKNAAQQRGLSRPTGFGALARFYARRAAAVALPPCAHEQRPLTEAHHRGVCAARGGDTCAGCVNYFDDKSFPLSRQSSPVAYMGTPCRACYMLWPGYILALARALARGSTGDELIPPARPPARPLLVCFAGIRLSPCRARRTTSHCVFHG